MADSNRVGFYIVVTLWTCLSLSGFVCWYAGVPGVSPAGAADGAVEGLIVLVCMLRLLRR
jgi:hypothetical protein